jgi:hypothetical protein
MLSSIARGLFVALAVVVALGADIAPASAQSTARKNAEEALRQGISAQSKRDHNAAVALLSQAVNSGALARSELGLALYHRAVSYRAQKQPALAISDLNSALFFKDALPSKERAEAIELRLKSYRDAGLQAPALATSTPRAPSSASIQAPGGPVASGPRIVNTAPPRVEAPVRRVEPRQSLSDLPPTAPILGSSQTSVAAVAPPAQTSSRIPAFSTQTTRGSPPPTTMTTRTTIPTTVASVRSRPSNVPEASWSTATSRGAPTSTSAAVPTQVTASSFATTAQPAPVFTPPRTSAPTDWRNPDVARSATSEAKRPETPAPSQWSSPAPPVSASSSLAQRPVETTSSTFAATSSATATTAATSAAAAGTATTGSSGVGSFFSSLFGQPAAQQADVPPTTSSVSQSPSPAVERESPQEERVAAVSVPAAPEPVAEPREARADGYDIEVVALHDRYRAEAVAKQIMVQYSSDFFWTPRKTRIEERPGPDGATLYSVRLGRYDDEASARAFCEKLEASGFNCDLVARR